MDRTFEASTFSYFGGKQEKHYKPYSIINECMVFEKEFDEEFTLEMLEKINKYSQINFGDNFNRCVNVLSSFNNIEVIFFVILINL